MSRINRGRQTLISPSGTECCYISSSSAPRWNMRAPRGGPLPAPMSDGNRCYSPSVSLATGAPWNVRHRQIHEDLGVPLFADHIRALTASFDSKLADVGYPVVRQLGRYLRWPRVDPVAWRESEGRQGLAGQSAMAKSTKRIAFGAYQPSAFRIPWQVFRDFPQL